MMQFPLFADLGTQALAERSPFSGGNMVYVMLKPSAELAGRIAGFEETTRARPADLLHTIIQPIGDRSWLTDADIEVTRRALSRVRYAPFLIQFDRITGGGSMALCGGELDNPAAQDFRVAILDALSSHFRWLPPHSLHPHMTLDDQGGRRGRLLDQPIAWMIEEFVLVESVHGETQHIEWGRWRLRPE